MRKKIGRQSGLVKRIWPFFFVVEGQNFPKVVDDKKEVYQEFLRIEQIFLWNL